MKYNESYFVSLDIITSGKDSRKDRILKLDAVRFSSDGEPGKRFHKICNPEIELDSYIQNITGISNNQLKGAEPSKKVIEEFFDFLSGAILVTYSANFAMNSINTECERLGVLKFANTVIDVITAAKRIYPTAINYYLPQVVQLAGINVEEPNAYQIGKLWIEFGKMAKIKNMNTSFAVSRAYS